VTSLTTSAVHVHVTINTMAAPEAITQGLAAATGLADAKQKTEEYKRVLEQALSNNPVESCKAFVEHSKQGRPAIN
jgi:hypothetical protein